MSGSTLRPADWTFIAPGHRSPMPYLRPEEVARRLADEAAGVPVRFHSVTCGYPGYSTFQGVSAWAGDQTYLGTVAVAWDRAEPLVRAVRDAQRKAAA